MAAAGLYRLEVLRELRHALLSFRTASATVADAAAHQLDQTKQRLNSARFEAERQLEGARQQLVRLSEDDDDGLARRELSEAELRVNYISNLSNRYERARGQFDHSIMSWAKAVERSIPRAVSTLQRLDEDASAYVAVETSVFSTGRISDVGIGAVATSSTPDTNFTGAVRGAKHPVSEAGVKLDRFLNPMDASSAADLPNLPEGFEWLSIYDLPSSEVPAATDPPKGVSEDQMRNGVARLWSELVPLINASAGDPRAICMKFDHEHGRIDPRGFVHEDSLVGIWDAFFGTRFSNQIRVEHDSVTGRVSVTNGRHRIKVARDLGWRYIPAQVIRHAK